MNYEILQLLRKNWKEVKFKIFEKKPNIFNGCLIYKNFHHLWSLISTIVSHHSYKRKFSDPRLAPNTRFWGNFMWFRFVFLNMYFTCWWFLRNKFLLKYWYDWFTYNFQWFVSKILFSCWCFWMLKLDRFVFALRGANKVLLNIGEHFRKIISRFFQGLMQER